MSAATSTHPDGALHISILGGGGNWSKIAALICSSLTGYASTLPEGSTAAAVTAGPGPCATDGPRWVADGLYDFALGTPCWYLKMAADGKGFFDEPLPLSAVARLPHDDFFLFATRQGSGISSIEELVADPGGHRISVPPDRMRHPVTPVADAILGAYGSSLADLEARGAVLLDDRPTDLTAADLQVVDPDFTVIIDEAVMTPRWAQIFSDYPMEPLALSAEAQARLEQQGILPGTLPAGAINGLDRDVPTVEAEGWLIYCRSDCPDEIVDHLLAALERRVSAVNKAFTSRGQGLTSEFTMEVASQDTKLALHPAANAFYQTRGYR